jgi:hypothetical protein
VSQQADGDAATIMINMLMHSPGSGDQAHGANGILTAAINELIIAADTRALQGSLVEEPLGRKSNFASDQRENEDTEIWRNM